MREGDSRRTWCIEGGIGRWRRRWSGVVVIQRLREKVRCEVERSNHNLLATALGNPKMAVDSRGQVGARTEVVVTMSEGRMRPELP